MRTKSTRLSRATRFESTDFWLISCTAGLICTLLLFHYTRLDLTIQQHFYDAASGAWVWDRDEPVTKLIFYDGIKRILVSLAVSILVALVIDRFRPVLGSFRRPLTIVLLSLIIVPGTVGILKANTNTPCPRDISSFGSELPYVGVLDAWPEGTKPAELQRCYPAGHASGGFALLALVLLGRSRYQRLGLALTALTIGWSMGLYKTVIGDHFFSHTLITMFLAIIIISCLNRFYPQQHSERSSQCGKPSS